MNIFSTSLYVNSDGKCNLVNGNCISKNDKDKIFRIESRGRPGNFNEILVKIPNIYPVSLCGGGGSCMVWDPIFSISTKNRVFLDEENCIATITIPIYPKRHPINGTYFCKTCPNC